MIKVTYTITGLPVPDGLDVLAQAMPDEMKLIFMSVRQYAAENGCTITVTTDVGQRIDVLEWESRELLDSFYTYANTLVNYDEFLEQHRGVLASIGASITRTEEEI